MGMKRGKGGDLGRSLDLNKEGDGGSTVYNRSLVEGPARSKRELLRSWELFARMHQTVLLVKTSEEGKMNLRYAILSGSSMCLVSRGLDSRRRASNGRCRYQEPERRQHYRGKHEFLP